MSNPLDITVEEARAIVIAEGEKKGRPSQELVDSEHPHVQKALRILRNIRESYGDILDVIAIGIYSQRGRFILELLQNVEDSDFNHTDTPSISFEVSPEKIIVESNQDGFSAADVGQICHTGNSWKRGLRGYVGEKGIGFKSVFKVASRVDIQSNAFSFFFEYNGGQSGEDKLGYITPIPSESPIPQEQRPLTRMTLNLNGETAFPVLVSDFRAIPETLLLFLTKLKEIKLTIHFPDQARPSVYIFRRSAEENGTTSISKFEGAYGSSNSWLYSVVRTPIEGLPDDPSRPEINECEAVLAFPIDEYGSPRIHTGYDVYAFLPVCTVGFNFLLQADFLLQANRQEVIIDSEWNNAIIDHLAVALCSAMETFCTTPSLRFRWLRFLPIGRAYDMNPLWRKLTSSVIDRLKQKRILYPDEPSQLYIDDLLVRPSILRTLPPDCLDGTGLPLFADRPGRNRKYLSFKYKQEDVEVLKLAFQLPNIEDIHLYHRIKQDLDSPRSVMKNPTTDAGWHTRAAELISSIMERSPEIGNMIRDRLDLVPLGDGRWVSASTGYLYFPPQSGPAIPPDLATTIHPEAAENESRRDMFLQLGITTLRPASVIDRLRTSYIQGGGASNLADSKAHLRYLYWHSRNTVDGRISRLWVYDNNLERCLCCHDLMYMPSEEEYGPLDLFRAAPLPRNPNLFGPACDVAYINSEYMDLFSLATRRHDLTWLRWLESVLGVRRIPRLKHDAGSLSPEFRHILCYRPEKIVRLLEMHWAVYRREMTNRIEEEISGAEVSCQDGTQAVLSSTYFPLQGLLGKTQELHVPRGFPFLDISNLSQEERAFEDWRFLERFQVKFDTNLNFYLDCLRWHERGTHSPWNSDTRTGILKTYELIFDHCTEMERAMVKETFHRDKLILHPRSFQADSISAVWLDAQTCVWRGPDNLLDKVPLTPIASYQHNTKLSRFFQEILGIKNANWRDYLDALSKFKRSQAPPRDLGVKVVQLYDLLSKCRLSDEDWASLLDMFENDQLIYVSLDATWVAPSRCLWASPVPIPGKTILEASYSEDLKPFFRDRLKISPAVLNNLVEGLRSLAQGHPSITNVKGMIRAINSMEPKNADLAPLLSCSILPVRRVRNSLTEITMLNYGSNFAVVDRTTLADIFVGHVGFLDFSLEEVRELHPFVQALGLDKKYLSRICTKQTACNDGGVVDMHLTQKFQNRAYHLLRCAVSNRSPLVGPNPARLYNQLQGITVLQTSGISTQYTLQYESGDTVGPIFRNTGHVHIQEEASSWKIFVPQSENARKVCYISVLPHALTKLFGITDGAGETIGHVLNSDISVIDELLEFAGVAKVLGIEPPPRRVEVEDQNSVNSNEDARRSELREDGQGRIPHLGTPASPSITPGESPPMTPSRQFVLPRRSPSLAYPGGDDFFPDNAYLALLDNVIRIARRTALPRNNILPGLANGQIHPDFNHDAAFGIRSQGQMNHDFSIGAAGELFVYECLKNLGLDAFGPHNWTSTIREKVLIHPEYRDMGPWPGRRETSDLRYQDSRSMLTRYLINLGYLDEDVWADATPEYMIEVKTTTGESGDRFFMSSNQFQMMQNMALVPGRVSEKIYVIFRVHNLGRENLGVRIYLDPEAHRGRTLAFKEHQWTVTAM